MNTPQQITLCTDELQQVLEPLIRKIIREELFTVIQQTSNIFFLVRICHCTKTWKRLLNEKLPMTSNSCRMMRCGMSEYIEKYEKQFTRNLKRYSSLKQRVKRCVDRVTANENS